MFSSRYTS